MSVEFWTEKTCLAYITLNVVRSPCFTSSAIFDALGAEETNKSIELVHVFSDRLSCFYLSLTCQFETCDPRLTIKKNNDETLSIVFV